MNEKEFQKIVSKLKARLFRVAYRYLKDTDGASDAVQEVFLKLWKQRDGLDKIDNIEAFTVRITRNLCLDIIKLKKTVALDVENHKLMEKHEEDNQIDEHSVAFMIKKVKHAMVNLPEQQQEIMQLKDFEGYDYEEISQIMELSVNTIRVNLSRARKKIKELISKNYGYKESRGVVG